VVRSSLEVQPLKQNLLSKKIEEQSLSFSKKLKLVLKEGELDYWWERKKPPNLSPEVFKKTIEFMGEVTPRWVDRKSKNGPHGTTGELQCFKFEFEIRLFGVQKRYFLKGYFFDRDELKGVSIQSFREQPVTLKIVQE